MIINLHSPIVRIVFGFHFSVAKMTWNFDDSFLRFLNFFQQNKKYIYIKILGQINRNNMQCNASVSHDDVNGMF